MAKFYSRSLGGFYADEIHGSPKLMIADPTWTRPLIDGLTDENAVAPLIEVVNPDCLMPADAVPVTDEQHAALFRGQDAGKAIQADAQGRLVVVAPPMRTPAELRIQRWAEIKAERERRIQYGGYKVGLKWFHSDTFSRTQQMGLVMSGANVPAGLQWKTMDGTFVLMTQALATQIFAAASASDIAIFTAAETHRTAMLASADPAAYGYSKGWPLCYGEVGA
jgi:Domain of unknown function (DUF4376)